MSKRELFAGLGALLVLTGTSGSALPDEAVIVDARATAVGDAWTFAVTLSHADAGWDDYANGWRVILPDGTVLGTRELLHPHVNEQPFTRSLPGVKIPSDIAIVLVEARTKVEGWGTQRFEIRLD